MFRQVLRCLLLSLTIPFALCQQPSPQAAPLTDDEKRVLIQQLQELRDLKLIDLPTYEAKVKDLEDTVTKEQQARKDAVAAEQLATQAAQLERDSYKAQMEYYKSALGAVTKKPSGWCRFARILTFGIKACH